MKTAEEWQVELCGETSVESIRSIQRDAFKAGMTEAADKMAALGDAVAGGHAELSDDEASRQEAYYFGQAAILKVRDFKTIV